MSLLTSIPASLAVPSSDADAGPKALALMSQQQRQQPRLLHSAGCEGGGCTPSPLADWELGLPVDWGSDSTPDLGSTTLAGRALLPLAQPLSANEQELGLRRVGEGGQRVLAGRALLPLVQPLGANVLECRRAGCVGGGQRGLARGVLAGRGLLAQPPSGHDAVISDGNGYTPLAQI